MTRLEKLIEELCPNGVEYVKLGSLCTLVTKQTGFDYTNHIKSRLQIEPSNNNVPYIQTKFFTGKSFDYNTDYYVPIDIVEKFPKITLDEKCLLFSIVGASIGNVGLFPGERKCFLGGAICVAKVLPEHNIDYLYYCIESNIVQYQIRRKTKGAGQATITVEDIREFQIPLPPLEVQAEIVRILDDYSTSVTALQQELEKELTARKKQYEYYASKLFLDTNADNIEMSELADFVYGYTDTAKDEGDARFIRITDINEQGYLKTENEKYITLTEDAKKSLLHKGDIIMARTGATYGKTLYFDSDFPSVFASFLIRIIPNDKLLNRYYWHFTKTPLYWEQANKLVTNGGQPQFNTPAVKKIKIPVPPLPEQERIVQILDRFDKLCNDISEGLPAEIEARQKQYAYYRDKLLTFKELIK